MFLIIENLITARILQYISTTHLVVGASQDDCEHWRALSQDYEGSRWWQGELLAKLRNALSKGTLICGQPKPWKNKGD